MTMAVPQSVKLTFRFSSPTDPHMRWRASAFRARRLVQGATPSALSSPLWCALPRLLWAKAYF